MTIGVLKEPGYEIRVSLPAEAVAALTKKGITVLVENGAGEKAFNSNTDYEKAGAQLKSRDELIVAADIILLIQPPEKAEIEKLKSKILIGVYQPLYNNELFKD